MRCTFATVLAVVSWDRERSEPQYLSGLQCDAWEVVVPELVFEPGSWSPREATTTGATRAAALSSPGDRGRCVDVVCNGRCIGTCGMTGSWWLRVSGMVGQEQWSWGGDW